MEPNMSAPAASGTANDPTNLGHPVNTHTKQWGGRFAAASDPLLERFSFSVAVDGRLIEHDITGSIAHVRMLGRQGIIDASDAASIESALREIAADVAAGTFILDESLEDVHTVVEAALRQRLGPLSGKLHTA